MARQLKIFTIAVVCLCLLATGLFNLNLKIPVTTLPLVLQRIVDSNSTLTSLQNDVREFVLLPSTSTNESETSTLSGLDHKIILKVNVSYDNATLKNLTETCFSLNSKAWLEGPRRDNTEVPDAWLDDIMQPHLLLDQPNIDAVLDQTLCYATGRFRNFSLSWNSTDPTQIHDWEFRLLYLALHRMLHVAAYPEYQLRKKCGILETGQTLPYGLNNFDYECPNAKFLVTVVNTRAGVGTVMRQGVMPSFFMAISSGRIPLFVQSVKGDELNGMLTARFPLASCERGDWQCAFLPTSPCVLTLDELRSATILNEGDLRYLKRRGQVKKAHENVRVLVNDASSLLPLLTNAMIMDNIHKKAKGAIKALLNDCQKKATTEELQKEQWKTLRAASESHRVPYSKDDAGEVRKLRTLRVAFVYMMRPNPWARQEIDNQIENTIPLLNGSQDRQFFGLPIRGTDKCLFESTCLGFDRYMELVLTKWRKYGIAGKIGTILLTSEDPTVPSLRLAYAQNTSFPLEFALNDADVRQGHGRPKHYYSKADKVMISSLTAIKIQLQADILIVNCCSSFHTLMLELAGEGCGADPQIDVECLNRIEDPRFRICCSNEQNGVCAQIWAEHKKNAPALKS